MCPSLIQIGSKTAEKNSAQKNRQRDKHTNKQTDRHYENNGHLAVNQKLHENINMMIVAGVEWRKETGTGNEQNEM